MRAYKRSILISFVVLVVGGCATIPTGPSVMVMPLPGKPPGGGHDVPAIGTTTNRAHPSEDG